MKSITSKIAIVSLGLLGLLVCAEQLAAYRGGTSGGYSGAPGERDCTRCHSTFPVNSGTAQFDISTPPTLVGSSNLTVTGRSAMASKIPSKSAR